MISEKIDEEILKEFPGLIFCERINFKEDINIALPDEDITEWLVFLAASEEPLEWLRIKLNSDLEVIFSKLDEDHYLVVANKSENIPLLIQYLQKAVPSPGISKQKSKTEIDTPPSHESENKANAKQKIIPDNKQIARHFKKFFVVHDQNEMYGGDFYWYKNVKNCHYLALLDCGKLGEEGELVSEACHALLNQVAVGLDEDNILQFVEVFYHKLESYNKTSPEILNSLFDVDMGIFCFNFSKKEISYVSAGIPTFIRKENELILVSEPKIINYDRPIENTTINSFPFGEVKNIYTFSDGLINQPNSETTHKLGIEGIRYVIEQEDRFDSRYYTKVINKWRGKQKQIDDTTLMAISL